jgi:hypothetical protein
MIQNPAAGMRVKVVELGSTIGMLINEKHLSVRKAGTTGTITRWVPGHGGDVWWVKHDGGWIPPIIGAYCIDELEELND